MLRAAIVLAVAVSGDWLGPERCASTCHPDELAAWKESAHAKTTSRAPRCASCHTTEASGGRQQGVTCESCHGAGAHYAKDDIMRNKTLATALGLRDAKASCARCHREPSTRVAPFDHDRAWKAIAH